MKIITFDGYPASGKTAIRKELRDKYRVAMPERHYSFREKELERIWIKQITGKGNPAPYLSNLFPLLTFKRLHPKDNRLSHFEWVSIEDFNVMLHDLIHRAGWEQRGEMLWTFRSIISLDFESYPMTCYFLNVPLSVCRDRRSDFPWGERDKYDSNYTRFWKWLSEKEIVQFIDGTQSIDSIVEKIAREVKLI